MGPCLLVCILVLTKSTKQTDSLVLGPNGHMVVQVIGQVVGNQVFARHTNVHRVPVLELPSQLLEVHFRDVSLGERRRLEEDKVPDFFSHLLWPIEGKERENEWLFYFLLGLFFT